MKLAAKLTLIFVAVFGVLLVAVGVLCYSFLQRSARSEVLTQAQLMEEAAAAMRSYTDEQIKPWSDSGELTSSMLSGFPSIRRCNSLTICREISGIYVQRSRTHPTNLRDRAVDWEADIINTFRNTSETVSTGERETPEGRSIFLAHPIVVQPACLECHSTPAAAPPNMLTQYGTVNGFGWKLNEVVGAQIVSVPSALSSNLAQNALHALVTSLVCFALVTLIVLNVVVTLVVIRPLGRITATANDLANGMAEVTDLPASGRDELATLAGVLNRLRQIVFSLRASR